MSEYIVKILHSGVIHYYLDGDSGMYNTDLSLATRFLDYYDAVKHLARVLHPSNGNLPGRVIAITIGPLSS